MKSEVGKHRTRCLAVSILSKLSMSQTEKVTRNTYTNRRHTHARARTHRTICTIYVYYRSVGRASGFPTYILPVFKCFEIIVTI
jgi:hypothetical protein